MSYDAILFLSFGGPEGPDDVMPFLRNVTRGRGVPEDRLQEVAQHYHQFGGVSPINQQNRALIAALVNELRANEIDLPVYWGNRNWHPMLADTMQQMAEDGVQHALTFVTSAYSSYSGCRQYREDIAKAQEKLGESVPTFDKLRVFYNHPGFVEPMIERTAAALKTLEVESQQRVKFLFSAHSIPDGMAATCDYQQQLREASRLVAEGVGVGPDAWQLVYQSRSGPPQVPWLEPDVVDVIQQMGEAGEADAVVVVPIGFISDHMEVLFDLDEEANKAAENANLGFARAGTVGTHPRFVQMIRELIQERLTETPDRLALGNYGPNHDVCPVDCCKYEPRRPAPSAD